MFKTQFNTINSSAFESIELQNRLESGLNLSDSSSDRIISVSGEIGSGYCEISNGEMRYGGRITFNVIYGDEPERLESGTEFSFKKLGDFKDGDVAEVLFLLSDVTVKSSGGMLYAEAAIDTKIELEHVEAVNFLSDIDCLKKQEEIEAFDILSSSGNFEVEDEFECAKCKRVLESHAEATLGGVYCEDGIIVCDGEVVLSLAMLPFNGNKDILKEIRTIPFRYELESDLVKNDMPSTASVGVVNIALKVYVDEENEVSRIGSVIGLKFVGKAQRTSSINVVDDAYSDAIDIFTETKLVGMRKLVGLCVKNEKYSGRFNCNVPENSRFLGLIGERCEVVGSSHDSEKINFDFMIYGDAVFIDGEGLIVSRKIEYADKAEFDCDCDSVCAPNSKIVSLASKMRAGKIEFEISLRFSYTLCEERRCKVVSKINEGAEKPANKSAISVYLAKQGDTEWEVSKALGTKIDDIYELNPTLEFPLQGNERIITFRQK